MSKLTRRRFLQLAGVSASSVAIAAVAGNKKKALASEDAPSANDPNKLSLLIDTTVCIGCRTCEAACNKAHNLAQPKQPFNDRSVLQQRRRTSAEAFTVVNQYPNRTSDLPPIYRKMQCMHCDKAACTSACPVGALHKASNGATIYDDSKCIGCRYCMTACPYDIPTFTWNKGLMEQAVIRKCNLCYERTKDGKPTACAEACPVKAIRFGKRSELLEFAKWRIANNPGRYVNQVYGENEAGGTNVLYLAGVPFEQLGLPSLGSQPLATVSETVMNGTVPFALAWGGTLAVLYKVVQFRERHKASRTDNEEVTHHE